MTPSRTRADNDVNGSTETSTALLLTSCRHTPTMRPSTSTTGEIHPCLR